MPGNGPLFVVAVISPNDGSKKGRPAHRRVEARASGRSVGFYQLKSWNDEQAAPSSTVRWHRHQRHPLLTGTTAIIAAAKLPGGRQYRCPPGLQELLQKYDHQPEAASSAAWAGASA